MTFSDFAQMMYPFIRTEETTRTTCEYVRYLTSLIMEKSLPENTKNERSDVDNRNPLSTYDESTLAKYYNGRRNLSPYIAREIISHLDQSHFTDYLMDLPHDTIVLIGNALEKNNIELTEFSDDCIIETCAKVFVSILYNCACKDITRGKRRPKEFSYEQFEGVPQKGCTVPPDWLAQLSRDRMWWEKLRKKR